MRSDVRIVLAGDAGVGKSTLITSLIKETFVERVQKRIPEITLPSDVCPEGVSTKIIDTCSGPEDRGHLDSELRRASVICMVYSVAHASTFERLPTYWLPYIRSLGVNVPVILVGNQIDQRTSPLPNSLLESELAPVMGEFKEVETCVECSSKLSLNVSEVFYFAQKAVLYPTAPLYDSKAHALKPNCVDALRRIFRLCDSDKDGLLSDAELNDFQRKCFDAPLQASELEGIKDLVLQAPVAGNRFPYDDLSATGSFSDAGTATDNTAGPHNHAMASNSSKRPHPHLRDSSLTLSGFLYLHTLFIQRGRLETTWTVLRTFGYGSDLSLQESFVSPAFNVPSDCSVELSPHGYQFLTDVFEAHDKDRDGSLSKRELSALFSTVPATQTHLAGAHPWSQDFPQGTTVTDEAGRVTLQGWLAQWSMTTLLEPRTTLAWLAYLGYPSLIASASASPSSNATARGTGAGAAAAGRSGNSTSASSLGKGGRSKSNSGASARPADTTTALQLTNPRRVDKKKKGKLQRNVLLAYVVGAAGSGKSSILRNMVGSAFEETYQPTGRSCSVVCGIEQGGAEKYLVLQEFGSRYESEALRNAAKVSAADIVLFVYDSSDTNSFSYISNLRQRYPTLTQCPSLFIATKADLDLAQQRHEVQPHVYCSKLGLKIPGLGNGAGPLNISIRTGEVADLFQVVCATALNPRGAIPGGDNSTGALGFGGTKTRWAFYFSVVLIGGGLSAWMLRGWRGNGTFNVGLGAVFRDWSKAGPPAGWLAWIWNGVPNPTNA
ncbi:hypothetical protein IE81DRAFT_303993 [Ceraceosorus guamensis]|uniref:Mitochondrial Rho GTPase 1 n=1 Tax=Ceraceosorus guamensis TaxID=1522189 RepID=A0A316VY07_9BASI|nr:hypothetical protein IE81DRAFT_303993 [Ceraceosorus guamensis]PWN41181.1 hypothetical protein IE81DRAFT_303993 [Ceraceosorus guamensis]